MSSLGEELSHSSRKLLRELGAYIERDIPVALDGACEAAKGADLVVSSSLHQAAPTTAEHLEIPLRSLLYCPQSLTSSEWPPLNIPFLRMPRAVNRLVWWSMTLMMNRMVKAPLNRARGALGLTPVDEVIGHLRTATPVVVADPPLCGPVPADCGDVVITGALVVDDAPPLDAELEAFLAAGPPPLYMGFGSMSGKDPEVVTEVALDVARRTKQRLILAGGWGGIAPPKEKRDDVLFIKGTQYTRLFPRCRFVIHHGGAGTTTAAARAGVPQLAVSHAADQYFWGHRIEALGVGPKRIDRPKLSSTTLLDRVSRALADEGMPARAQALAHELKGIHGNIRTAQILVEDARRARA